MVLGEKTPAKGESSPQQSDSNKGIQTPADKDTKIQEYVVNGGPGSTEVVYRSLDGKSRKAFSNVVKVPIQERCEESPKIQTIPEQPEAKHPEGEQIEEPVVPAVLLEQKPQFFYTLDVSAFPACIVASANKLPEVIYHTEVSIPLQPPKIKIRKITDEQVLCCDRQLTFRIVFENEGGTDAYNINISDIIPERVEYVEGSAGSSPHMANIEIEREQGEKATKIVWTIEGPIAPGEQGEVFYTVTCPRYRPNLVCYLRFEPKVIPAGQEGTVICSIGNRGKGPAQEAKLIVELPQGVEYKDKPSDKKILLSLGDIAPDATATKRFSIKLASGKLDDIQVQATASNWAGCACEVPYTPSLKIKKSGPTELRNRTPGAYTILVQNISSKKAPASNCILIDRLPPNITFKSASHSGVYDEKNHTITWQLGTLLPGDMEARNVELVPQKRGTFDDEAKVSCEEGITVTDSHKILVSGVSALLVQEYDTEDPVEVGKTTTYVIEVRNQGFHPVTNIDIVSSIPPCTQYVTANAKDTVGNSYSHQVKDETVVFEKVPLLDSGEKVIVKLTVRVLQKGEVWNTTTVKCNEFSKVIVGEEPTTTY